MSGYYWYADNPNCGRCGHLNSRGFCNMTACIYPVVPQTTIIPKPRTNADRIRAMTDEELADEIFYSPFMTKQDALDWLKQEATE